MIQSTRMVGGMLGTALIGTLVTRTYVARVPAALASAMGNLPGSLVNRLRNPEMLVDRHSGEVLISHMGHAAGKPLLFLPVLRGVFVTSIHLGFVLTALVAIAAMWQVRRISHLRFHQVHVEAIPVLD